MNTTATQNMHNNMKKKGETCCKLVEKSTLTKIFNAILEKLAIEQVPQILHSSPAPELTVGKDESVLRIFQEFFRKGQCLVELLNCHYYLQSIVKSIFRRPISLRTSTNSSTYETSVFLHGISLVNASSVRIVYQAVSAHI